jgi:hypothetical protein
MSLLAAPQYTLVNKFASVIDLTDVERGALELLPTQISAIRADQDIVRQGDRPTRSCSSCRVLRVRRR